MPHFTSARPRRTIKHDDTFAVFHVQRVLIERAARLTLYIELMDAEALEAGTMTERNSRQYLAWVNALRLCLREIGVDEAKPAKSASIASIVARHKAASP
jgi:hypothetical protein